jgi:hypothetical protein
VRAQLVERSPITASCDGAARRAKPQAEGEAGRPIPRQKLASNYALASQPSVLDPWTGTKPARAGAARRAEPHHGVL